MQVLMTWLGQRPRLEQWTNRAIWPEVESGPLASDRRIHLERQVACELPGDPEASGPFRYLLDCIQRFDIFPPEYVTKVLARDVLEMGDTVGIRYRFLPGLDLFFCARVVDRFDRLSGGTWKAGFTYRTLMGNPLIGEETFSVEKDLATGRVVVALRSWSRPGTLLARVFQRLVRHVQMKAGRGALDHLHARVATASS